MKKENFKIKIEDKKISISSILPEEKEEEKYYFKEFHKRKFNRAFALPENIIKTKISASYEDGVLKILIPKDKAKEKESNFEVEIK
jgi:HSP20 family protein